MVIRIPQGRHGAAFQIPRHDNRERSPPNGMTCARITDESIDRSAYRFATLIPLQFQSQVNVRQHRMVGLFKVASATPGLSTMNNAVSRFENMYLPAGVNE
jgi:hypothetical protein